MPLYDYACAVHGSFSDWRPMKQSDRDVPCPSCGKLSRRTVSNPYVARLDPAVRMAHQRNEKSAHEPRVLRREELDAMRGRIGSGHGHRHDGGKHRHGGSATRPTMLGHAH